ncbi:MAG TPA: hypothetical protein VGM37_03320 [Armatimonadota bacterium]|jgi:hypothetical protein
MTGLDRETESTETVASDGPMGPTEIKLRISAIARAGWDELVDVRIDRKGNIVGSRVNSARQATVMRALKLVTVINEVDRRKSAERIRAMTPEQRHARMVEALRDKPAMRKAMGMDDEDDAMSEGESS